MANPNVTFCVSWHIPTFRMAHFRKTSMLRHTVIYHFGNKLWWLVYACVSANGNAVLAVGFASWPIAVWWCFICKCWPCMFDDCIVRSLMRFIHIKRWRSHTETQSPYYWCGFSKEDWMPFAKFYIYEYSNIFLPFRLLDGLKEMKITMFVLNVAPLR